MILYVKGDIFQSPAQVLVNAVNTVGVMGKGIALEYKRMFPQMFDEYRMLCENGQFDVGSLWLYKTPNKWILNFPTKKHWRQPSRVEFIEEGLKKFADVYSEMGIYSIAFPPLGCGNGQLDFKGQVQPLMEHYLRNLPIEVFVYPDRKNDFVEHLSQESMQQWLRSEPQSLPFSEVWDDLRELLGKKDSFETVVKHSEFTARIVDEPRAIQVLAAKKKHLFPYESLMSFWQQLRSHGFSMRHIAPGLPDISYIIPVFAELQYISPVHVADQYEKLNTSKRTGLQVLPSAFAGNSQNAQQFEQLPLI